MFKFILLCFCINFAFSSPVIQFFIEEEIKLEQPTTNSYKRHFQK